MNKRNSIVDILGQHLAKLIYPKMSFGLVRADQSVHRQHVHRIIMAHIRLISHSVFEVIVINDVVASNQAGEVKGLAGRVNGYCSVFRVLRDALSRNVLVSV